MSDHISVCICTFRRNALLARLIEHLRLQETDELFSFSIVVVDNDIEGSARDIVSRLSGDLCLNIDYGIEPERTIPAARNHALRLARGNYIAIIDDDEFPTPTWLITMYKAAKELKVDGVLGPVFPHFDQEPPAWLIKGRFCERPVLKTGTLLRWDQTRTGNVLLRKGVFDEHQLSFDTKWKTSGSDRAFFKTAIESGYRFMSVKEAPVFETVPPARWTKSYYLRRALVHGFNAHRNSQSGARGIARFFIPVKSVMAVAAYAAALPFAACLGTHWYVKCLEGGGHHFSRLCAILGIELVKKRDF